MVPIEISTKQDSINSQEKQIIELITSSLLGASEKKVFAILNINISPPEDEMYEALYQGFLRKPGEIWLNYRIPSNEFPNEEELSSIQGFVISGSEHAVQDCKDYDYLNKLYDLIRNIYARGSKILGICFGAQSTAYSLGGDSQPMNIEKSIFGYERMQFLNSFHKLPYVKASNVFKSPMEKLNLSEIHKDHINKIPSAANLYATSNSCGVEIFGISNQVLCMQGHPEFSTSILTSLKESFGQKIPPKGLKKPDDQPNCTEFQKICFEFLHNSAIW